MFGYCKLLLNILKIPMLSEVNKVFMDNPNFVSSLLYFSHPPVILTPGLPFNNCPLLKLTERLGLSTQNNLRKQR